MDKQVTSSTPQYLEMGGGGGGGGGCGNLYLHY